MMGLFLSHFCDLLQSASLLQYPRMRISTDPVATIFSNPLSNPWSALSRKLPARPWNLPLRFSDTTPAPARFEILFAGGMA